MALEIFKLVGSIFVDSEAAKKSISEIGGKAEQFAHKLADGVVTTAKWAAGVGAAAGAAGAALYKVAEQSAQAADRIDKMSIKLGFSREAFQELDYILGQSGASIDSFAAGAKTLTAQMTKAAEGNEDAAAAFDMLGISVTDAEGNLRSQEDVLYDAIRSMQEMEDGTEKTALAQQLFGKQGLELLPLLNSEAGSFDQLKDAAHDLGLVIGDETIDAGVAFGDAMDNVKRAASAVMTKVGAEVMPIFMEAADWVMAHMPEIQAMVSKVMNEISHILQELMPVIKKVFEFAGKLWESTLKPALDGILAFLNGVFTGDWSKAWEGVKQIFQSVFEGLKVIFKEPINFIINGINKFITAINGVKVPDWVPLVGGLGFSIPTIPLLERGGVLAKGQTGLLEGNGAEAVVPLDRNKAWIHAVAQDMASSGIGGGVQGDRIVELLETLIDVLPESMAEAVSGAKLSVNNREFARLVREVY